jgi:hypothetical protein
MAIMTIEVITDAITSGRADFICGGTPWILPEAGRQVRSRSSVVRRPSSVTGRTESTAWNGRPAVAADGSKSDRLIGLAVFPAAQ